MISLLTVGGDANNSLGRQQGEEYIYSSARDYYYGKQCGLIKIEYLL